MSKILVDTIDTRSGTSTLTLGSSNASTITLKSGATLTNFPANTPLFFANKNSSQTISDQSDTKITFPDEMIDTDNAFASDRFTVPSGKAGKYYFFAMVFYSSGADQNYNSAYLFRNGSVYTRAINRFSGTTSLSCPITAIMDLSAGDYVEVYTRQNTGGNKDVSGESQERRTFFGGYRMAGT